MKVYVITRLSSPFPLYNSHQENLGVFSSYEQAEEILAELGYDKQDDGRFFKSEGAFANALNRAIIMEWEVDGITADLEYYIKQNKNKVYTQF